jgi:hypothetical protein
MVFVECRSNDSYIVFSANNFKTEFVVNGDNLERNSFLFKAGKKLVNSVLMEMLTITTKDLLKHRQAYIEDLIQTSGNIPISQFANSGNEGHWTIYYQSHYWTQANNRNDATRSFVNAIAALKYEINKNINLILEIYSLLIEIHNHENASKSSPTTFVTVEEPSKYRNDN